MRGSKNRKMFKLKVKKNFVLKFELFEVEIVSKNKRLETRQAPLWPFSSTLFHKSILTSTTDEDSFVVTNCTARKNDDEQSQTHNSCQVFIIYFPIVFMIFSFDKTYKINKKYRLEWS